MRARFAARLLVVVALDVALIGCGKKGPPLAPLYLVPSAVTEITVRRVDDTIRLRFALPSRNQNGPGIDLDRVEIYAVNVVPGGEPPANREFLTKQYLVGQIAVKPPPVEGGPETTAAEDTRPAPGEIATFVDRMPTLPIVDPAAAKKKKPAEAPAKAIDPATAQATIPSGPPVVAGIKVAQAARVYVLRGVARSGRSGAPSARVEVPLGAAPDPPGGVAARNTEKAVVLEWLPAVAALGGAAPTYNIYRPDAPEEPVNPKPVAEMTYEYPSADAGVEACFAVRAVDAAGSTIVESPISDAACVVPKDVFAPAPPKNLAATPTPGAVQLIWDANTEADVAGYLVLRAALPDETLQPLTETPIRDTVYRDTTAAAGADYLYVVVAVDSAPSPNRSKPSAPVRVTAR
jgi:predicted small lipoprotein YifL